MPVEPQMERLIDAADRLRRDAVELLDRAVFDGLDVDGAVFQADLRLDAHTSPAALVATVAAVLRDRATPAAGTSRYRIILAVHDV